MHSRGPNLQNIPVRTEEGRRVVSAAFRTRPRPLTDPNRLCRDCDRPIPANAGHSTFDIGAMFLGKSAAVCDECWAKRAAEKAMAEATLVEAGYVIEHVPEERDDGWRGGRWHAHRNGACFAANSWRESCIQNAYNDLVAAQAEGRALTGWPCDCIGGDNA
jgi:hypothetical protein